MMNFDEIYNKIYKENFEELNNYHKKQTMLQIIIAVLLFIIYIFISIYIPYMFFIGFICYIILTLTCFTLFRSKKYVKCFKKNVITSILKNYNSNFTFNAQEEIPYTDYLEADFEQSFDFYHSEDCISGKIQEICNFKMAEVITEKRKQDDNEKNSYTTIFNGLFAKIDIPENIPCDIQIREDSKIKVSSLPKLEMDSIEFEKLYNVYTDNSIICMQLFTSDIMQMLIDFNLKYKLLPEITIKQNNLYLRFKLKKRIFEPKLFKKVLDYKEIQDNYLFINSIMNLCNAFLKNILETSL